ncbi:MAG: HEPN domain-containing protein [Chloroflexota bacterium]|nr:HEPN domain-containing protein [Chloroflexota bacterium]
MKDKADLVRGWLRKPDSDLTALNLALNAEDALDTACFHAQQAAEKVLKAYLVAYSTEFPCTHRSYTQSA